MCLLGLVRWLQMCAMGSTVCPCDAGQNISSCLNPDCSFPDKPKLGVSVHAFTGYGLELHQNAPSQSWKSEERLIIFSFDKVLSLVRWSCGVCLNFFASWAGRKILRKREPLWLKWKQYKICKWLSSRSFAGTHLDGTHSPRKCCLISLARQVRPLTAQLAPQPPSSRWGGSVISRQVGRNCTS